MQVSHGKAAIAMLTTAHELYKAGSQGAKRLMYHIGALLARERLAFEDVDSAHRLLDSVAGCAVHALPALRIMLCYVSGSGLCTEGRELHGVAALLHGTCPFLTSTS